VTAEVCIGWEKKSKATKNDDKKISPEALSSLAALTVNISFAKKKTNQTYEEMNAKVDNMIPKDTDFSIVIIQGKREMRDKA